MKKLTTSFLLLIGMAVIFNACKKDDPPLPPNMISFQSAESGIDADETEITVTISLSRPESVAVPVTVSLAGTGVTYGTDFTTLPAATGSDITLSIPAGQASADIKLTKTPGLLLSGSESVKLTITSASPATIGTVKETVIKFSTIVSTGSTAFVLPGKTTGSNYANSVFVDLSNNATVAVDRKSWNIGFTGGSDFKVILNHAYQTTAARLDKTDITSPITEADTAGIELDHDILDPLTVSLVDAWDGDLTKTAFGEIAAADADNKVFVLSFEGNKDRDQWYKLKVTRDGSGYKVQYARIGESTLQTLNVPKNSEYNLTFVSLETNSIVAVEPRAKNWDIEWSYSTYNSGLGSPYWFQDFILLNYMAGAEAGEVLVTETDGSAAVEATTIAKFNAFAEADLAGVTMLATRDAIGSKWRATTGAGIRRDRFYIVKDPNGNIYKIRFVKMGVGDTGERGRPEIDFKLVKAG